jgi:hypothetical protein
MTQWVVLIQHGDTVSHCANERVDLALAALAMGEEVMLVVTSTTAKWPLTPPRSARPSVFKRMRQVLLYGGELALLGEQLPEGWPGDMQLLSLQQLAEHLKSADRVLT